MKKIFSLFIAVITVLSFSINAYAYDFEQADYYDVAHLKGTTLNVFNWGEYISEDEDEECYMFDVNAEFEKLTGIKVNYSNYATNEDLYAKLKSGGSSYDIIIPSDYMISRFISEGLVQKINFDNVPNYKYIDENFKNMYYDENNEYSVPYCVSTVGLIYNTEMVEGTPTSWSVLWDPMYAGKIVMFDNPRDSFAVAQKLLGQSLNTTDSEEWRASAAQLIAQKPLLQGYVQDEVYDKMISGEAALAPYYAGDYLCMQPENESLAFVYPDEGYNIFVDAVCIPSNAEHVEAAEMYINYLLDPTVGLANAYATGYATPNIKVRELEEYEELSQNPYLYPEDISGGEYFFDLDDETRELMNSLWLDVKASGEQGAGLYICYAVTFAIIAAYLIYRTVKKKRMEKYY